MIIAILDLGTNTFHLVISEWNEGKVRLLHKEKQMVQLGKESPLDQSISKEAAKRARRALKQFSQKIRAMHAQKTIALGTSAFRTAGNGSALAQALSKETALPIEIISGQREAYLIYKGAQNFLPPTGPSLIVDIGGGSIECILCDQAKMYWSESFEVGAQRLFTQFGTEDPLSQSQKTALHSYLCKVLRPLSAKLTHYLPIHLIGCSGTFVTLGKIHALTQHVPAAQIFTCTPQAFQAIYRPLITMNREERLQVPGMPIARVDMIVVASLFIEYLLSLCTFKCIHIPHISLRDGILQDFIEQQQAYDAKTC